MKADLLLNGKATDVRVYMHEKFKVWGSWKYSKSSRVTKTLGYYTFASTENKEAIRAAYSHYFKEPWPTVELARYEQALQKKQKIKYESGEAQERQEKYLAALKRTHILLVQWQKGGGKVQEGEQFFLELRSLVDPLIKGNFDPTSLQQENFLRGVSSLTTTGKASLEEGVEANLDFMLGVHAKSVTEFKFDDGYNRLAASLVGEMKTGVWGEGSVKGKIGKGGLTAEAAIAAACGMEFKVDAEAIWARGDFGLRLAGDGRLFMGAEANAQVGLKIRGTGVEAGIKAGAFVGLKASCGGEISLQYMGGDMVKVRAEAEISLGLGAEFEASIKCTLFDGTDFKFKAALTHGVGGGVDVNANINFDRIHLAANAKFRDLMALPTIMKGYSGELMDQERLNNHYLAKSIEAMDVKIKGMEAKLKALNKIPLEKRSLLVEDDFD